MGVFSFLFKKQKIVEELIFTYLDNLRATEQSFYNALEAYFEKGERSEEFDRLTEKTHEGESKSDDIRLEIETIMYEKALIPESREDILGLLENIDTIPNCCQRILYMIQTQNLVIPSFVYPDIRELINISMESFRLVREEVKLLFKEPEKLKGLSVSIDRKESTCDQIERRIISRLFDSDLEPIKKILLKELILEIGDLTDYADRVSRRINIIGIKRRV